MAQIIAKIKPVFDFHTKKVHPDIGGLLGGLAGRIRQ